MGNEHTDNNGHGLIDAIYDKADSFVTGVGHALGVDVNADPKRDRDDIDDTEIVRARTTAPERTIAGVARPAQKALPAPSEAKIEPKIPAVRPFEVIEVTAGAGAGVAWVVTNGIAAIGCSSAAKADAVIAELEKAGAPTARRPGSSK